MEKNIRENMKSIGKVQVTLSLNLRQRGKLLRYLSFILFISQTLKIFAQYEIDTSMKLPLPIECKIVRIDSVGNHYVIYAIQVTEEGKPEKYKIVSAKDSTSCQNIMVDKHYKLTFNQHISPEIRTMNGPFPRLFSGGAVILPYGWGDDLYFALDVRGLCHNVEFLLDVNSGVKEIEKLDIIKFKNKRAEKKYNIKKYMEEIGNDRYYEENPLFEWEYDNANNEIKTK